MLQQLATHINHRRFDPIAEAKCVHELFSNGKMSAPAIAEHIGKTETWVRNRLSLLQLTPLQQELIARRDISVREALVLVRQVREQRAGRITTLTSAQPRRDRHWHREHPLAGAAMALCARDNHDHFSGKDSTRAACGKSFEQVIRADQSLVTAAAAMLLPGLGTQEGDPEASSEAGAASTEPAEPAFRHEELQVLHLAAEGLTNPEIGRKLNLAPISIGRIFGALKRRLSLRNRVEIVAWAIKNEVLTLLPSADVQVELSDRQRELIRLVADGLTDEEITEVLCTSMAIVKYEIRKIYGTLGLRGRTHLAAYAVRNNLF